MRKCARGQGCRGVRVRDGEERDGRMNRWMDEQME